MMIGAERQQVQGFVVVWVFVNVMNLRTLLAADCAHMAVFAQNSIANRLWSCLTLRDHAFWGLTLDISGLP
jgi:hypothetical protein